MADENIIATYAPFVAKEIPVYLKEEISDPTDYNKCLMIFSAQLKMLTGEIKPPEDRKDFYESWKKEIEFCHGNAESVQRETDRTNILKLRTHSHSRLVLICERIPYEFGNNLKFALQDKTRKTPPPLYPFRKIIDYYFEKAFVEHSSDSHIPETQAEIPVS